MGESNLKKVNHFSLVKNRPEFQHTPEKTQKWLSRKPKDFIAPIPAPYLTECLHCFEVYTSCEYRWHVRREKLNKHQRVKLCDNKEDYKCKVVGCDYPPQPLR